MSDLVHNAADPKQVRFAKEQEKRRADQEAAAMRAVLATEAGRRAIWTRLEKCGVFRSSWDLDPHTVYFNEGRRQVGLELIADIAAADETALLHMMSEARRREADERIALEKAQKKKQEGTPDGNG